MSKPLLLDIGCLCDAHTDDALELMHKAMGEDPADIWAPHPNPFIRQIVEMFTRRGLDRVQGMADELRRWIGGAEHRAGMERPVRPAGAMERWSAAELGLTRLYLQSLPPAQWVLDDWLTLIDYLTQRYLPAGDLRTEADWLATRSQIMGRVQASLGETDLNHVYRIGAELPPLEAFAQRWGMTPHQASAIEYGRARAAESVTGFQEGARRRLRRLIVDHQEGRYLGDRAASAEALESKLLDEFGMENRDWRRIAVTEATENVNQGVVAASPPGTRLRRVEKYLGACAHCRSIDGRVVKVVDPDAGDKDGETEVWLGKSNVGRFASPRRRQGSLLVEREPHERWWIAAGAQHPHCRGSWVKASGASRDPEFEAWLRDLKGNR